MLPGFSKRVLKSVAEVVRLRVGSEIHGILTNSATQTAADHNFDTRSHENRLFDRDTLMNRLRLGLIGAGFMGKAHAVACHAAPVVFPLSCEIQCELLAEVNAELAQEKAKEFGFRRATDDWRKLVTDPSTRKWR